MLKTTSAPDFDCNSLVLIFIIKVVFFCLRVINRSNPVYRMLKASQPPTSTCLPLMPVIIKSTLALPTPGTCDLARLCLDAGGLLER
jgi:hypothetical protein